MTPRYEWTPASEPPDSDRMVLTWVDMGVGVREWDCRWYEVGKPFGRYVTHWRDIAPPNLDEGKGE
jgi:hypothetical protein